MRIVRALIALFVATLLGSSVLSMIPAGASASLPVRVITSEKEQVTYRAFRVVGNIEAYPSAKANLQRKACGSCSFKTVKKIKTTAYGNYRTKIFAPPLKGTWKWRIKVKAKGGYAASYSEKIAIFNK